MSKPILSLKLELETVTPLLLSGAEPGAPELRAPAFRGALRYWLRATLGGVLGDRDVASLHQLETAVCGSTEFGSPISVRVSARNLQDQPTPMQSQPTPILPHKSQSARRPAFNAGQTLTLRVEQLRSDDADTWRAAYTALQLALTFGGLGLRSRRGYGTLRIVESSDATLAAPFPTSLAGWTSHINAVGSAAVMAARELARSKGGVGGMLPTGVTRYPSASTQDLIRIHDLRARSAMDAITQFMAKVPQNPALGGIQPRQASPLWVRPIQLDDHYGLLLVVLASQFGGANYPWVRTFLDQDFPPAGRDIIVKGWNA
jgi:CRISPR-associated protein Cmr1